MKKSELFDREEAMSLLPDGHDESVIAAENLTLATTPYKAAHEKAMDAANAERESALSRIAARREELTRRANKFKNDPPKPKVTRERSFASEVRSEIYQMNHSKPGLVGPGAKDSPAQIAILMEDLGINLDMKFSKKNTYDLMSVLLTCSEAQLEAMQQNSRVPVMIKTIIKSILADYKDGRMTTVERLWNRLFGPTFTDEPQQAQAGTTINVLSVVPGIGSGTRPISREGYALIRDKVFGPDAEVQVEDMNS